MSRRPGRPIVRAGFAAGLTALAALPACAPQPDPYLGEVIRNVKHDKRAGLPADVGRGIAVESVRSSGNALIYGIRYEKPLAEITAEDEARLRQDFVRNLSVDLCAQEGTRRFIGLGGEIHTTILSSDRHPVLRTKLTDCK